MAFLGASHVGTNGHFPLLSRTRCSCHAFRAMPFMMRLVAFLWPCDSSWCFCLVSCCLHTDYLNTKLLGSYHDGLGRFHSSYPEEMGKCLLIYGIQFDTKSIVGLPGALFVCLRHWSETWFFICLILAEPSLELCPQNLSKTGILCFQLQIHLSTVL